MAENRKDAIDTIIANIFRYELLFGLTKHVYDTRKHRLVYSRTAHIYSLALHLAFVIAAGGYYKLWNSEENIGGGRHTLILSLAILLVAISAVTVCVCLCLHWTLRANVATLLNELIQIWHSDMAPLAVSGGIRYRAAKLLILKALGSGIMIVYSAFGMIEGADTLGSLAKNVYVFALYNVVLGVMLVFSSSLIFSTYLFEVLNFNLERIVVDINGLCPTYRPRYGLRHKIATLEDELNEIGRIHSKLQKWLVRFKDMYQVEILFILMSFLVIQIIILFVVCLVVRLGVTGMGLWIFVTVCLSVFVRALDLVSLFYIAGQLLGASREGGDIMQAVAVPSGGLNCVQLERSVDMLCIRFKCEKLRLRICGLVDLDWVKGFAVTEAAFLYVLLLIQMDYENS